MYDEQLAKAEKTIAAQQARLDAIAVCLGRYAPNPTFKAQELTVLATGKPRREVERLVRKYGKKEKSR